MQVPNGTGPGVRIRRSKHPPVSMLHPSQMFYGNLSQVSKRSISVKRSLIGIKSNRWRVIIVFGQATECHSAFVGEELRII